MKTVTNISKHMNAPKRQEIARKNTCLFLFKKENETMLRTCWKLVFTSYN